MDKKVWVLALLLSAMFGGCSSDESVINEGGENNGQEVGYIAVNIVQPASAGSRAETPSASEGFEYGGDGENAASKALFFIFNSSKSLVGSPYVVNLNGSEQQVDGTTVEKIYKAVLVIDGAKSDPTVNSKYLVCVLNAPEKIETDVNEKINAGQTITIDDLKSLIGNYESHSDGTFIMSNSVYNTNDDNIATAINEGKVKKFENEAMDDPVEVYVERVVAKVEASVEEGKTLSDNGAEPEIDGTVTPLTIKVTGIEIANIADESYLFKSVKGATTATEGIWTELNESNVSKVFDTSNHRSYWETVPDINAPSTATATGVLGNRKLDFKNKSYNAIAPEESNFDINNVKYTEYIQPNTSATKTCVLVTAQLMKDDAPITNLAYIRGIYTTTDKALNEVAKHLANAKNWYKMETVQTEGGASEEKLVQLDKNDLEWKNEYDFEETVKSEVSWLEDYEVVAQLKSSPKIYNKDGAEIPNGANVVNSYLRAKDETDHIAKNYRARVFTKGMCYYFVNIDHSTAIDSKYTGKYYGVVRNHLYRLTLESIGGIGTPVFDPNDIIIPQTTSEPTFYLSAKVNVLAWKLVKQGIAFGESDTPSTGN